MRRSLRYLGTRRGMALIATLAAISLLGILAVTSARVARARMVGARRLLGVHTAVLGATRALDSVVVESRMSDWMTVPVGSQRWLLREGRDQLLLNRLQPRLFRVEVATHRGDSIAPTRHASSLLVRAESPRLDRGAPLVLAAGGEVAVGFRIVGAAPDGGCLAEPNAAVLLAADTATVNWDGRDDMGEMRQEELLRDPAVFDREVALRRAAAQINLAAGERYTPVADSAHVIVALGDLTLGPGAGEGSLLVLGRLSIVGPLRYRGSILALGGVTTTGDGIELAGTLTSAGTVRLTSGTIRHDPCAVEDAALRAARLEPLREWSHAWLP